MKKLVYSLSVFALFLLLSCGQSTDVVDSGTYQGTISEVEPEKTEIYVKTGDGKTLELYFTDQTTLTKDGVDAEFSQLEEGQTVEVEVEKVGKRLDPIAVRIIE
jgi:hypothetical protein